MAEMAARPGTRAGAIGITGGARGIGAAIALELARRGFTVGCLTRGARLPEGAPETMVAVECDVTDDTSIHQAMDALAARAGGLAGLVNNAGIHSEGPSEAIDMADYDALMTVNARAVFVGCRAAFPHLKAHGGTIINIGSFFDKLAVPGNVAYCASKAAVGAITRCLAAEWAKHGIIVLDVAPGYVETDFNRAFMQNDKIQAWLKRRVPLGRAATLDEIARLVGMLFAERIPYLSGDTIYIDGGHGHAL
jgi:NAD(P)-dependent dehydrogenase (short-subunit alcohol dehydrogenase family)